jgi:hypothetical protein
MQTKESIEKILGDCETFFYNVPLLPRVLPKGGGFLLQVRGYIMDNNTQTHSLQSGGKYYISSHAIDDEVVATLWKATQDFIIHEARETFQYKGQKIYGPHFKVDALRKLAAITDEAKRDSTTIIVKH